MLSKSPIETFVRSLTTLEMELRIGCRSRLARSSAGGAPDGLIYLFNLAVVSVITFHRIVMGYGLERVFGAGAAVVGCLGGGQPGQRFLPAVGGARMVVEVVTTEARVGRRCHAAHG